MTAGTEMPQAVLDEQKKTAIDDLGPGAATYQC
jgi:hypothetical protein